MNREMGLNHQKLLNEASQKMQEAQNKERVANDLDRLATEGEKNIHRLCDKGRVQIKQAQLVLGAAKDKQLSRLNN